MASDSTRTTSRQTVQSAKIGAEILKALARLGPAASLTNLSEAAGMAPAKAHRYLQAMTASGLAAQEKLSGRYTLGPEAINTGMAALAQLDVIGSISESLPALRDDTEHTCFVAVWGSQGAIVVHVVESIGEVIVLTRTSGKMPLLRLATGLTFAAWLPQHERDADAVHEPAEAALQAQLRDPASPLPARLEAIRNSAISVVKGLMVPGIDATAAPVFGARSEIVAVVTLVGTDNALDPSPDGELARKLTAFVSEASARLGAPG